MNFPRFSGALLMSSDDFNAPTSESIGVTPARSAGALLREARLSAGVHIESIAFALKVPVSKIEALEEGDFTVLPDAVFARALAGSVCRTLKIDAAPILALLPQSEMHRLTSHNSGVNAVFRDGSERSLVQTAFARMSWPLALAVFVLLVGAGLLAWAPSSWLEVDFSESTSPGPATVATTSSASGDTGVSASIEMEKSTAAPVLPAQIASSQTTSVIPEPTPESGTLPVKNVPRVVFNAKGETWIQVKDAQGAVVLERILRDRDTASVTQPGKLSVVVGRADVTEVRVAGKNFDIVASARENVARFEVNP
ncbi:MAG: helix-turn-helix domain-containing protein [Giesbergeria sp.]